MVQQPSVRVCPKCGKPLEIPISQVWPEGMPIPDAFWKVFGIKHGGMLPVTCDCHERDLVMRATRWMLSANHGPRGPVVCYTELGSHEAAYRLATTWAGMAPPNFVAWSQDRMACYTSRATYDGIRDGRLTLSMVLPVSRERPRETWAELVGMEGLA